MKTGLQILLAATAWGVGAALLESDDVSGAPQVGVSASVQISARADFEAPLAPIGTWAEVGHFGRCWRPRGIEVGWRPYCEGEWVWTDCGWYWESDEPWAWACYHYGTWEDDPELGWVWVPDVEWAPAWVEWRTGGEYIGWAPCAPVGVVVVPGLFAFVEVGHFHDRIRHDRVVFNNPTIINQTRHVGDFRHETRAIDGRQTRIAVNDGPGAAVVEKATGRKETAVPVQQVFHGRTDGRDARPDTGRRDATPTRTTEPVDRAPDRGGDRGVRDNQPGRRDNDRPVTTPREGRPDTPVTPTPRQPETPPRERRPETPVTPPRQPEIPPKQPVVPPVQPPPTQPRPVPTRPERPIPTQPERPTPPREDRPRGGGGEERPRGGGGEERPRGGGGENPGKQDDKDRGRGGGGEGQSPMSYAGHCECTTG